MSKSRILAAVVGLGLVYMVGSRVYEANQAASAPAKKKAGRVINVDLTQARIGPIREELLLTGSLKPKETVDISPKITGRIERMHFLVGDIVRPGDVVAELEADELAQQVMRSEASYAVGEASVSSREAQLANAKADLERSQLLFDQDLLSPQEFQQSQTSLEVLEAEVRLSEAQLQQAQAELNELKIRLEGSKIYAPMEAVVSARYVDPGALVNPNTPILQVVNLYTMVTQGNVPERYVENLTVGSSAEVNVDAIPGQQFEGRVARIAPVLDAATRSAIIEIDIRNPRHILKAEMFARITVDLGSTRDATLIPRDGLVYRGQQPGVYVVPEQADRPIFRVIETGLTREGQVEVLANLDAGTRIVGRGATMLRDGDRITTGAGGRGGGAAGRGGGAGARGTAGAARPPGQAAPKKGSS